jgi:hypothetical protein
VSAAVLSRREEELADLLPSPWLASARAALVVAVATAVQLIEARPS